MDDAKISIPRNENGKYITGDSRVFSPTRGGIFVDFSGSITLQLLVTCQNIERPCWILKTKESLDDPDLERKLTQDKKTETLEVLKESGQI